MRTQIVQGDGLTITLRGKTRGQPALESEYLVRLKTTHPDTKGANVNDGNTVDELTNKNPRAWTLLGVAQSFRVIAARCTTVVVDETGETMNEPFTADNLVQLFDHFRTIELMPDKSDVWSKVETELALMDKPPEPTNPNSEGDAPKA